VDTEPGQHRGPAEPDPQRGSPGTGDGLLVVIGCYCMLLVFGVLLGMIGSFQYNRALGSFPVAAPAFAVGTGVACVLGGWGMRRPLGGLMPAVGWFVASFVLAMGTPGGSVLITNTNAGKWFLFGGALCAVAGVLVSFVLWSPARVAARRGGSAPGGPGRGRLSHGGRSVPLPGARKPDR
jgi:hypothetical protein